MESSVSQRGGEVEGIGGEWSVVGGGFWTEGRQEGRRRRGGAVVVFSHVDYSTTDADTLLPFVRSNSVGYFGLCI